MSSLLSGSKKQPEILENGSFSQEIIQEKKHCFPELGEKGFSTIFLQYGLASERETAMKIPECILSAGHF
jgi:hypothetical protein